MMKNINIVFNDGFPGWNGETPNTPRPGWAIEEYLEQLVHTAAVLALPPVTEENNGDFMTVVDGEWAPADVTLDEKIEADVDEWLEDHPEATTTVQDGAITFPKLAADLKSLLVHDTVSGPVANFDYAVGGLPFDSVVASIEPTQDLHGYANPWPAGGGENILPMPITSGSYANGVTVAVNPDLSFVINKSSGSGWTQFQLGSFSLDAGTYTLIEADDGSSNASISILHADGTEITNTRYKKRRVFTLSSSETVKSTYSRAASATDVLTKIMLFARDTKTADDYSPYANICPISGRTGLSVYVSPTTAQADATTYAIDWTSQAGTVYGGTVDVVTGVLTVDRAIVDLGERNYTKGNRNTDNTGYVFYFRDTSFKNRGELISSQFKEVLNIPNWEALPVNCCNSAGGSYIVFCADYSDAATFKTAMSGVQLCYELATPLTYQLTPKQIAALTENYVWASNGGNVSVTFIADTKSYIDRKIAEAIAAALNA